LGGLIPSDSMPLLTYRPAIIRIGKTTAARHDDFYDIQEKW
jgi:hypothetical protein